MGVKDLLNLAPVEDTQVYESGIKDVWSKTEGQTGTKPKRISPAT